jgi:GTPase
MSYPKIALIGQQNVGKSTLYNRLTKTKDAIVADYAGLTRDRLYGRGRVGNNNYYVIDTAGFIKDIKTIDKKIKNQTKTAIAEADIIFFMIDAKLGINNIDYEIAKMLRKTSKKYYLIANKIDGENKLDVLSFCLELGLGNPIMISAAGGRGINELIEKTFKNFRCNNYLHDEGGVIKITLVGKPNVGKSTLVNYILQETRCITANEPGTTIDNIAIPFTFSQQKYIIIDTAGLRKKNKVFAKIEKFSMSKTKEAIQKADIVLFLTDASQSFSVQDLYILRDIKKQGRPCIILNNKWDKLNNEQRKIATDNLSYRLSFDNFAIIKNISAINNFPKNKIFKLIKKLYHKTRQTMRTTDLNNLLKQATISHQPPKIANRRIKLKYAHLGSVNPPTIIIHGNQVKKLPQSYLNYLNNFFIRAYDLAGVPMKIICKEGKNPYSKK